MISNEAQLSEQVKQQYSRQLNRETLTEEDLSNIFKMKILLVGLNSNCSEIIKNLTCCGSQSIYLFDSDKVEEKDIRNIYQLYPEDIGKRKDESMKKRIPLINAVNKEDICYENLRQLGIKLIVLTKVIEWKEIEALNLIANQLSIPFILSCQFGLSFLIFSDFGKVSVQSDQSITHNIPLNTYFSSETLLPQVKNITVYCEDQENEIFILIYSIIEFIRQNSILPKLNNKKHSEMFFKIYSETSEKFNIEQIYNEEIIKKFAETQEIELPIISQILGALTATEILKTIIPRFQPLDQVLFWENFTLLNQIENLQQQDIIEINKQFNYVNDYYLQFGSKLMNQISNLKILLVGCGAVGCEQVKNLYQMSACTGDQGHLYLVDDDLIELSNLHRQALFTLEDIKQSKAESCMKWIKSKDSSIKVSAFKILMCEKNENIFNNQFFENLDLIIIAVDSVHARHYLSNKAIQHKIFLVESATGGFDAQSQCQVPYFSKEIHIGEIQCNFLILKFYLFIFIFHILKEINTQSCTPKSVLKEVGDALTYSKNFFQNQLSCLKSADEFFCDKDLFGFLDLYQKFNQKQDFCDMLLKLYLQKIFNNIFYDDVLKIGDDYNPTIFDNKNYDHIQFVGSLFEILKNSFLSNKTNQKYDNFNSLLPTFDKDNINHGNLVYQIANLRAKAFNIEFKLEKYDAIGLIGDIIPSIIQSTSIASGFALLELFTWIINKEKILQLYSDVVQQNQAVINQTAYLPSNNPSPVEETKYNQIYLSKEYIDQVENEFYQFGFKQYFGRINQPKNLGSGYILFTLTEQLQNFKLTFEQQDKYQYVINEINKVLFENKIESAYIVYLEQYQLYREDAETSQYASTFTKQLQKDNLNKTIFEAINSILKNRHNDTIFYLYVYSSKLNCKQKKVQGPQIAQIKLIIKK